MHHWSWLGSNIPAMTMTRHFFISPVPPSSALAQSGYFWTYIHPEPLEKGTKSTGILFCTIPCGAVKELTTNSNGVQHSPYELMHWSFHQLLNMIV